MDLTFTPEQQAFRAEVRTWLTENSAGPVPGDETARFAQRVDWQRRLNDAGWAAVHWPAQFGGRGATYTETAIFYEELAKARTPLLANGVGLMLAGPTIMAWGTPEQQARFLPPIMSAEEIWCQGFSEPEAGSDLASLTTRAVRDGEDWVITGQKVWTSFAHYSKWCMLLARTDPDVKKHRGITFFLMDMEQPGIDIRPIRQITGECEFNELFLDGVRIPDANRVGEVNNGWVVALTTLMNERAGLGFALQATLRNEIDDLFDAAIDNDAIRDPRIADRLGELYLRVETLRFVAWRALSAVESNKAPGPEGSIGKWLWSETAQQIADLAVDILGTEALRANSPWSFELMRALGYSIEGGTTQVQKNIIAERVLGLPKAH
ncbi:acyl-CoA dehydrogenase family protein [Nocardia sp. NBC_01388]|uniref:acyl-CoA dehydrogenase family protein n=1 Tax=Nocardia sp. NBC_01388 TaxID=2903596 RepID=UPI00324C32BC